MQANTGRLSAFVAAIERRGYSPFTPFIAATWIASLRLCQEHLWIYVPSGLRREPFAWLGHTLLFYLALILSISAWLRFTTRRDPRRVVTAVAAGMICGILPPFIDVFVYGPGQFSYDYQSGGVGVLPWHFFDPPRITPAGEAIVVWLSMLLIGVYAWMTTRTLWRVVLTSVGHYLLIVLFLAVLPTAAFRMHGLWPELSINDATAAWLLAAGAVGYGLLRPHLLRRWWRRLPHSLLAPSLVLLASAYHGIINAQTALAMTALFISASVFSLHNDYFDRQQDQHRDDKAIADRDDVMVLTLLPIPLWLVLGAGHFWVVVACLLFTVVGFAYHGDPLRLKCVFPLSYKTEGLLGLACFMAGVLVHTRQLVPPEQVLVALLSASGVSVVAWLKDGKDLEDDRAAGARTIYVILSERGLALPSIDVIVGAAVGVCLLVPSAYLALAKQRYLFAALSAGLAIAIAMLPRIIQRRSSAVAAALWLTNVLLWTVASGLVPDVSAGG